MPSCCVPEEVRDEILSYSLLYGLPKKGKLCHYRWCQIFLDLFLGTNDIIIVVLRNLNICKLSLSCIHFACKLFKVLKSLS